MRRANPRSSTPDWRTRWNVASPTKASVGRRMGPNMEKATPVLAAVATSPRAIRPPDTAPRNTLARPIDSEIVALRAPCSVKRSVVTNVTAPGRRSLSARSGLLPQCHCCPGTSASDRAGRLLVETGLTRPPVPATMGLIHKLPSFPAGRSCRSRRPRELADAGPYSSPAEPDVRLVATRLALGTRRWVRQRYATTSVAHLRTRRRDCAAGLTRGRARRESEPPSRARTAWRHQHASPRPSFARAARGRCRLLRSLHRRRSLALPPPVRPWGSRAL